MSRGLPESFLSAVTGSSFNGAFFFRLALPSGNLNLWTGQSNITFEGETFLGAGGLIGVSSIEEGPLQSRSVTFTFTGQGSGVYQTLQGSRVKGKPVYMWMAVMNSDYSGLLANDSYYLMNKFYISKPLIQDSVEGWTIALECETEFSVLFRPNHKYLSNTDQQTRFPGDTFFRFMKTLPGIDLPWGMPIRAKGGSSGGGSARPINWDPAQIPNP